MPPRTKRPRTDATDASPSSLAPEVLEDMISELDVPLVRALLLDAATNNPEVAQLVKASDDARLKRLEELRQQEAARVIDFDHYSKSAWYELNHKYDRLSCSRQFGKSGEVRHSINSMFDDIVNETQPHSSFGTKRNALETMRKMFKSLCLSVGDIPKQLRIDCDWGDRMLDVLDTFTDEDIGKLARSENGAMLKRLRETRQLSRSYCICEEEVDEVVCAFEDAL